MSCNGSNDMLDSTDFATQNNNVNNYCLSSSKDLLSYEAVQVVDKIANCIFTNLFFFIGGPANLLNMIVFYRQGLRDRMNLCLFCLAFADLMLLATFAVMSSYCFIGITFPEQKEVWKWFLLKHCLQFVFSFIHSSGCVTMIIAVERCVCVMFPMKSSSVISTKTMTIILLVTFIVIQLLCSVYIIKSKIILVKDICTGENMMTLSLTELYRSSSFFSIIENIVLSFIPFLNFIVVFLTTTITVVKLRGALTWRKSTARSYLKGQEVLMKMLVTVSSIYILCEAPTIILALARFSAPDFRADGAYRNFYQTVHYIMYLPGMLYCSINFFVYVKMSSRFRRELQTLCLHTRTGETSTAVAFSTGSHVTKEQ